MRKRAFILTPTLGGIVLASSLFLSLTAMAGNNSSLPPPSNASQLADEQATLQAFEEAAANADAALRQARAIGGEWSGTGKTLQQALIAAQDEDYATAIKLFETIRVESEKGYQQALAQREAAKKEAAAKEAAKKAALKQPDKAKAQ